MKKCPNCSYELKTSNLNSEFLECSNPHCKVLIREKNIIDNVNINNYTDIYNKNRIFDDLKNDLKHYTDYKNSLKLPFNENLLPNNFDKILSFGGGFPKLEVSLGLSNTIIVFDFLSDIYEKYNDNFFEIYKPLINDKQYDISYRKQRFSDKNISKIINNESKNNEAILLSFVHIFEHFKYDDVINILKKLKNINKKNLYFLIYQPNIETAKNYD